jgi:TRAP-type mannitol/chloroaromatic compound transport system permease small subunit
MASAFGKVDAVRRENMLHLLDRFDAAMRRLGVVAGYLVLTIGAIQVCGSVVRYFFSFGSILLQELILNLNVVAVALAICFGVLRNVHTRVDLFNASRSARRTAVIEAVAIALFLLPSAAFLVAALGPYVAQSWASLEGSRNVGGLGGTYLVKSLLLIMALLLVIQALAILVRLVLRTQPYPDGAQGPAEA